MADVLCTELFARAPVYDQVFACLSPRSLVRVSLTCRAAHSAVGAFKNRAFNINRHFSRYFTDPIAFRSLQARTDTLVSGSNVLQFLDRTLYPEADLDLYTHPGHSFEVAQFLVESEGYIYAPRDSQRKDWREAIERDWDGTQRRVAVPRNQLHAYPMTGIRAVWAFEKLGAHQERLTIQIIQASSSPFESILGFHSTCVMNLISSDAAYALYPVATFEERRTLGLPASLHASAAIDKYVRRGWRIYFVPTPQDTASPDGSPFCLYRARWVGDQYTWVLPLDQTGVQKRSPLSPASAPLPCDPVLFNGWRLHPVNEWMNECECHYYPLHTTMFRYNYAVPEERLQFAVRNWAHHQGRYSHGSLSKENWVWFDADMPGFLRLYASGASEKF